MTQFWKDFFSSSNDTSYKRGIGSASFICLVICLAFVAIGLPIDYTLIGIFGTLTGGMGVLTVWEKIKGNGK